MALSPRVRKELRSFLGGNRFLEAESHRLVYAYDASGRILLPEAVALPRSTEEVSRILALSYEEEFPVIPRGAGTATTGAPLAVEGGLVVAFTLMDRILEINAEDLVVLVEPGVINGRLKEKLASRGLFYPPDPASYRFSTLGGNVATGAGGPRGLKYGVTRDYVLALEAVLPGGEVLSLGTRTHKGVVGYDLTRLLVGSEGTLAVISKIVLKVLPLPPARTTVAVGFVSEEEALASLNEILSEGLLPAAAEFMDETALLATEALGPEIKGLLLLEFDGSELGVKEEVERVLGRLRARSSFLKVASGEAAETLWDLRRAISPALKKLGSRRIADDIVIPRSKLPLFVKKVRNLSENFGLSVACFGHAGDGNLHVNLLFENEDQKVKILREKILSLVLSLSGTLSGEHGIGLTKKAYLSWEISPRALSLMREVKKVFDPKGLLNPGKIFSLSLST